MSMQRLRVEGGRTYLGRSATGLEFETERREIVSDPVAEVSRGRSSCASSEGPMSSVTRLLTAKLKLRVNSEKSAVARPWERKFLGFSFTNHKQPKRRLAPKAVARFKERVRELTWRTRGISLVRMVHDLAEYLRGWIGYFGRCETPSVLEELEQWLRRRLRSMVWKQWKRGTTRYRELRKRGVAAQEAAKTAGSSDGPWHLANTPALNIALSNAYFASLGLPELTVPG